MSIQGRIGGASRHLMVGKLFLLCCMIFLVRISGSFASKGSEAIIENARVTIGKASPTKGMKPAPSDVFTVSPDPDKSIPRVAITETTKVSEMTTIEIQVSVVDKTTSTAVYPHQAFLSVKNLRTGDDMVFIADREGKHMTIFAELGQNPPVSSTSVYPMDGKHLRFWTPGDSYDMTLILGDASMSKVLIWKVADRLEFEYAGAPPDEPEPGVFDFDLGVKKSLQPEFAWEKPAPRTSAPWILVILFSVLAALPTVGFYMAASAMGVFPLALPSNSTSMGYLLTFVGCLVGYVFILLMFWIRWNIITAWKYMLVLVIPTVFVGHRVLLDVNMRRTTGKSKAE